MNSRSTSILGCFLLGGGLLTGASGQDKAEDSPSPRPMLHPSLVALDSDEGRRWLFESRAREDYIPLSNYFATQKTLAYCGVASGTMVLNGLDIPRPTSEHHQPYGFFTQENFFTPAVERIITRESVSKSGMTLQQLGDALKTNPVDIQVSHASDGSLADFRAEAIRTLVDRNSFLVVNYLRKAIHQETGGHISPVAAYHHGEDRFLILDVARYKYPPVWVKAEALWKAMSAVDSSSRKSRGYLIVRAASGR